MTTALTRMLKLPSLFLFGLALAAIDRFDTEAADDGAALGGRYVAGVCQAPPVSVGRNVLVDPVGVVEADLGLGRAHGKGFGGDAGPGAGVVPDVPAAAVVAPLYPVNVGSRAPAAIDQEAWLAAG